MVGGRILALLVATALTTAPAIAQAQVAQAQHGVPAPEYQIISESDRALVKVFALGELRVPGVYNLPDGTELLALIAYAGGPTATSSGRIVLERKGSSLAYTIDELSSGKSVPLHLGDTITIEASWHGEAAFYTAFASSVLSLITLLVVATK